MNPKPTPSASASPADGPVEEPRLVADPRSLETTASAQEERLRYARVLVEIGDLNHAELEVAAVLDESPEHLDALSLFTKIKHMRRQLSLAVACSVQLQSKQAASGGQARMHLESMLHLAQDPAQGAGEFLALGQYQLVQKPTAYMALEEAFRLYVARRPNEACATCREVASRYHEQDNEVYKLAVLAEAWIYELIGNLQLACEILERLGLERGFETDMDRLLALVALYEKAGTRTALESALNICKYLERNSGGSYILGRLALLYRRLGDEGSAAEYERRHLAAYRRAMHRPSFDEVVLVAAGRFLPLERLREIRFHETDLHPDPSPREMALARALLGDFEEAKRLLASGTELLDLKYQADLESIGADDRRADRAIALYSRALREDPTDRHVIGWLLDWWGRTRSKSITALFRDETMLAQVLQKLESAVHDTPGDYRVWRRLALLFAIQDGRQPQERQFADRAAVLERSTKERAQAVGRALSAATYRFAGRVNGLIHEVWATREMATAGHGGALPRDDILGNLTPEMRDNVRNTFLAVREYAQAKFPHLTRDILDYNYSYKVTKEDEPSGGTSAGLPTALAFLSVFLQRPVSQDLASTGILVTDAHDVLTVRAVGDIEYKVKGAYHRNLRILVAPVGNRPVLELSGIVPRVISEEIVRYVADLDEAVKLVFGDMEHL